MEDEKKGTEATPGTIPAQEDLEAKVATLESEKAKIMEEAANYKAAYIKAKAGGNEDEDDRIRRISQEVIASSRIADINKELEATTRKALHDLKEAKIALANRTDIPVSTTTHSEGQPVRDTLVTPEQMAQFKAMGKTDKWIENYKRNLLKNGR